MTSELAVARRTPDHDRKRRASRANGEGEAGLTQRGAWHNLGLTGARIGLSFTGLARGHRCPRSSAEWLEHGGREGKSAGSGGPSVDRGSVACVVSGREVDVDTLRMEEAQAAVPWRSSESLLQRHLSRYLVTLATGAELIDV